MNIIYNLIGYCFAAVIYGFGLVCIVSVGYNIFTPAKYTIQQEYALAHSMVDNHPMKCDVPEQWCVDNNQRLFTQALIAINY